MDELFDAHFKEDGKCFTYRLTPDQSASIYTSIGESLASEESAEGYDISFREEASGVEKIQIFKLDRTDTFILYRLLGTYLQKRYPGNESPLQLHEEAF